MSTPAIVLVPGFWLGAWAWDEVAASLRAAGHDVIALTLPGLASLDADRSAISVADHVDAICEAVTAAGGPVVLGVHSGSGRPGYAVGVLRDPYDLTNYARLDVPTTAICTGFTSDEYKDAVNEGYAWLGGFAELRNVTWVDLPTSHWPMWSRPQELAAIIGDVARGASTT